MTLIFLALYLQPNAGVPVDVCEVLANIRSFQGNLVEVRGYVDRGLWGRHCKSHVVVGSYQFQDFIAVTPTTYDRRLRIHRVEFEEEGKRAAEEFGSIAQHAMQYNKELECTLIGLIETREPIEKLVLQDGSTPFGFGTQNYAPAQLILKSVGNCLLRVSK